MRYCLSYVKLVKSDECETATRHEMRHHIADVMHPDTIGLFRSYCGCAGTSYYAVMKLGDTCTKLRLDHEMFLHLRLSSSLHRPAA
jgi:hypothetical protein